MAIAKIPNKPLKATPNRALSLGCEIGHRPSAVWRALAWSLGGKFSLQRKTTEFKMFGLFKRKPKSSIEDIFDQLGQMSATIMDSAAKSDDLEVAIYGPAAVSSIVKVARDEFGIQVNSGTIFSSYLNALQQQDMARMVEMTKEMANALSQLNTTQHRGALIHFWFKGDG